MLMDDIPVNHLRLKKKKEKIKGRRAPPRREAEPKLGSASLALSSVCPYM
jgi:hypothetical protein